MAPPLNPEEIEYLNRFSNTRRMHVKEGPYYADPAPDGYGQRGHTDPNVINNNQPDPSQPGLWCQWVPNEDGTAIEWDQGEKFYDSAAWMTYLINTFLKPDAEVKQVRAADPNDPRLAGVPEFADHVLNGIIYAQGEEASDRWRLIVEDNEVRAEFAEVVWPSER